MWPGDTERLKLGYRLSAPPHDGSVMSTERVAVTYVSRRQRAVRDPSDGSVDTIVYVRVRYPGGSERECLPESIEGTRIGPSTSRDSPA